ncbi:hypothetical protein ACFPM0_02635 [Pseudonocardia sulfidoxydans]|uniref:hypothetical protein n=1 Tax=Pseudonocardia sulfidoxydans TaxID=54011 RepID=UPI00361B4B33
MAGGGTAFLRRRAPARLDVLRRLRERARPRREPQQRRVRECARRRSPRSVPCKYAAPRNSRMSTRTCCAWVVVVATAAVISSSSGTRVPVPDREPAVGPRLRRPRADTQPVLNDERCVVERRAEHRLGELAQLHALVVRAAERRRGRDGGDRPEGDSSVVTPGNVPRRRNSDVGPLRDVVGVELVEHQVTQRLISRRKAVEQPGAPPPTRRTAPELRRPTFVRTDVRVES